MTVVSIKPRDSSAEVEVVDETPVEAAEIAESIVQSSSPKDTPSFFSFVKEFLWSTIKGVAQGITLAAKSCLQYLYHHPLHAIITLVLLALLSLFILTGAKIHDRVILGEISERTVEELVNASRFTRSFNAIHAGNRELLRAGAPSWIQHESIRTILYESKRAGMSPEEQAVLLATAEIESGFNPFARASTTTACGLFQFVRATGSNFGLAHKDCMHPARNVKAAITHFRTNVKNRITNKLEGLDGAERVFRLFELSYYLHHDGPHSSNPSHEVRSIVLGGTSYLFRAYDVLSKEQQTQAEAPSFFDQFHTHLFETLRYVAELIPFTSAATVEAQTASEDVEL